MKPQKKAPGNPVQAQIVKVAAVATEAINANEKLKDELRKLYKLSEVAFQLELGEIKESVKKNGSIVPHEHLQIRRMFGHRDTTLPDPKSRKAFGQLKLRLKDDLAYQIETMDRFYSFRKKREHGDPDLWSHDDVTLMNNWDAKMATAATFLEKKPSSAERKGPPADGPKGWREVAKKRFDMKPSEEWEKETWSGQTDEVKRIIFNLMGK